VTAWSSSTKAQLIEDEAIFEEFRLLMNFQTDDRFLVTLVLIGSTELGARSAASSISISGSPSGTTSRPST